MDDKKIFDLIFNELKRVGSITTLNDLAKKLPFDQSNLNKIKNGIKPIPNGLRVKLSKKFKVNPSFNGKNEMFLPDSVNVSEPQVAYGKLKNQNPQTLIFLEKYRLIRENHHIRTDKEMCDILDYNVNIIHNAKAGTANVSDEFIHRFCDYFEVDKDLFYPKINHSLEKSYTQKKINKKDEAALNPFSNVEAHIKDITIMHLEQQVSVLQKLNELYEGILKQHNLLQDELSIGALKGLQKLSSGQKH